MTKKKLNEKGLVTNLYSDNTISPSPEEMRSRMRVLEGGKNNNNVENEYPHLWVPKEKKILLPPYGFMPGNDDEPGGIITGAIDRLIKYYQMSWDTEYKPLKNVTENIGGWFSNAIKYWISEAVKSNTSGMVSDIASGFEEAYGKIAKNYIQELSPLMRTLVASYAPGKSYIDKIYVYKKHHNGKDHLVPISFTVFNQTTDPTEIQLKEGIEHVDTNLVSPFDKMERGVSDSFLNREFIKFSADAYTGNLYKDIFAEEVTNIHRWFIKEDTKGPQLWKKDYVTEATLPASVSGTVEVYKKNVSKSGLLYTIGKDIYGLDIPTSGSMAWANVKGDFAQDMTYIGFGGIVVDTFLKKLGVDKEGRRMVHEKFYKIGSRIHEGMGVEKWLSYDLAA